MNRQANRVWFSDARTLAGQTELGWFRFLNKTALETKKETTVMSLHRGGSFETHEDNLAFFAAKKARRDRCHFDVLSLFRTMPAREAVAPMPGRTRTQRARPYNCKI